MYLYPDYVIGTPKPEFDGECRNSLTIDLNDGIAGKTALVIMKNPSVAVAENSDQTVNTVLSVMHNSHFSKVTIVNLIPIIATDAKKICSKEHLENIMTPDVIKKHDEMIAKKAKEATKIFVAWGDHGAFNKTYYKNRMDSVIKALNGKPALCFAVTTSGMPIHPSRSHWDQKAGEDDFKFIFLEIDGKPVCFKKY